MHKKLEEILMKTRVDLFRRKKQRPLNVLKNIINDFQNDNNFYQSLLEPKFGKIAIISEIKIASPSEGNLGKATDILSRAKEYELYGADCISVVTEKHYFKGNPKFVRQIKNITSLPILQKDFIIDQYQIYEAKITGSNAILLIARIVSEKDLLSLVNLANEIGIEPVVEINNEEDLEKSINTKTRIIAVNARDLDTFEVNVVRACELLKKIPNQFIKIGFSGIHSRAEVEKYIKAGVNAILVGTQLMKTNSIQKLMKELKNVS